MIQGKYLSFQGPFQSFSCTVPSHVLGHSLVRQDVFDDVPTEDAVGTVLLENQDVEHRGVDEECERQHQPNPLADGDLEATLDSEEQSRQEDAVVRHECQQPRRLRGVWREGRGQRRSQLPGRKLLLGVEERGRRAEMHAFGWE